MFRSRLYLRLSLAIICTVALFSAAIYAFSVPLIEEKTYAIELNASRTILDNVFVMADKLHGSLADQQAMILESHKSQLRAVVTLAASYLETLLARADLGEISAAQARQQAFAGLRSFKYGHNDYIWVTDYQAILRSHPDAEVQDRDASARLDATGRPIIPTIIEIARSKGEGYFTYPWRRPDRSDQVEKISYFVDMPKRGLVIGSGSYLDDINAEVERRKDAAINELRQALHAIRIARTGYIYIFDANNTMVIHPNPNIEGKHFAALVDPASGRQIGKELMDVADSDQPLVYRWDKPSDPGNYSYEKISYVRHLKSLDWYIASSVYVDELRQSSAVLGNRLLTISLVILVVACLLGTLALQRLVNPLRQLALTASRVKAGDLDAASGIQRDDEIGLLANAFDSMIQRLKDNILTLDSRVHERTRALEEAETRQRLILDAIPAAIAYLGRDETIRFANRQWATLVGRAANEVVGCALGSVIGNHAYISVQRHLARTWSGEEVTFEYSFPRPSGEIMVTKNALIPQIGEEGRAVAMFVLSLDISAEKATEARLREAERMNAVGQLSGGLAHDFNNLLSIILGNLAAAQEKFANITGLLGYLEPATRAGRRGADITSRLLSFSRQHPMKAEAVDVGQLIEEVTLLLRRSIPTSIALELAKPNAACWTSADQSQMQNALINLALNAKDAMPDGGQLRFTVARRVIAEPLAFDEAVPPGHYIEISVSDTGAGFSPEARGHAFEPFFTTKRLGSGLGLSMVFGFVKQSNGYITLDSLPGQGATLSFLLPETLPPASTASSRNDGQLPGIARNSGGLALIVDDDADLRQLLRGQLTDLGFAVLEASSADEALALIPDLEALCLVVSDIVMPGTSGLTLAKHIRAHYPEIHVVLISGFSQESGADLSDVVILAKPWEKSDLIKAIDGIS